MLAPIIKQTAIGVFVKDLAQLPWSPHFLAYPASKNIDVKTPELDHRELELFSSLWLDKIDHCDTLCVPCKSGLFIITPILRVLVPLSYILYPLKRVWQIYWMSHATPQYAMHYHHGILLVTAKWSGANQYGWTIQTNDQLWYSL